MADLDAGGLTAATAAVRAVKIPFVLLTRPRAWNLATGETGFNIWAGARTQSADAAARIPHVRSARGMDGVRGSRPTHILHPRRDRQAT